MAAPGSRRGSAPSPAQCKVRSPPRSSALCCPGQLLPSPQRDPRLSWDARPALSATGRCPSLQQAPSLQSHPPPNFPWGKRERARDSARWMGGAGGTEDAARVAAGLNNNGALELQRKWKWPGILSSHLMGGWEGGALQSGLQKSKKAKAPATRPDSGETGSPRCRPGSAPERRRLECPGTRGRGLAGL